MRENPIVEFLHLLVLGARAPMALIEHMALNKAKE